MAFIIDIEYAHLIYSMISRIIDKVAILLLYDYYFDYRNNRIIYNNDA